MSDAKTAGAGWPGIAVSVTSFALALIAPPAVAQTAQLPGSSTTGFGAATPPLSSAPSATTPSQRTGPGDPSVPTLNGSGERGIPTSQLYEVPGENPGYMFNLATYGAGAGQALASRGIYLHGALQEAISADISGGNKQVPVNVGFGTFGFDVDTSKAFGLTGGLIDFTMSGQWGDTHTGFNNIGSVTGDPYASGNLVGLQNLYYNQSLYNGTIQITAGRISAQTALPYTTPTTFSPGFDSGAWYCSFFTTSCSTPTGLSYNAAKNSVYYGSWGGVATYHPAPYWYVKSAVFEAEPLQGRVGGLYGWPFKSWGLNYANGAYLPIQFGYVTSAATSLYPTDFQLGAYYDTARYADKFIKKNDNTSSGLYGNIQQTIVRFSSDPRSVRGVSVFASGNIDLTGLSDVRNEFSAGLIVTGPFAKRSADALNLLGYTEIFDSRFEESRHAVAAAHHFNYYMNRESGFEVNYAFALAPGVSFSPYTQYIINPDQIGVAIPKANDRYAFAIGFKTLIRLNTLFGLPSPEL